MLVKAFSEDYDLKFRPDQVEGPTSPRGHFDWNNRLKTWRLEQQENKQNFGKSAYDVAGLEVSSI